MIRQSDDPYAVEGAPPDVDSQEYVIEPLGKKAGSWRLVIRSADLALYEDPDTQPFVILREQLQRDVVLLERMRVLVVNKPTKVTFKLPPEAVGAVADWIGARVLAAFYLKRRYAWVLPVAILWVLGSLPLPGDPDSGVEPVALDVVGLGLGVALVASWAFAKWRPNPLLFLVDSIWFLCLAGYLAHGVFEGRSKLWMLLVGLLLWMVLTGFKHYARFRGVRLSRIDGATR